MRAFLLVEFPGAWGTDALRDARLPTGVGERLRRAAADAGVRVLLARRHGRKRIAGGVHVVAAHADPVHPWLETGTLDGYDDLADLDLPALRAGTSLGLESSTRSVFGVCTHGRHDACCAERGRPVASALAAAHPEETWEISHIGGDRFAGNLLVLPHGLYYGRLEPASALAVAGSHLAGELELDHLRGRSGLGMAVQAAEIGLRRELGETREAAVAFVSARRQGVVTAARFAVAGTTYAVQVRTSASAGARLTCGATRDDAPPLHEIVETRVDPDARPASADPS